jgi:hypothetical protein
MRTLVLAFVLGCAFPALAEGPGSRIGTTPEVPPFAPAPVPSPSSNDAKRCAVLKGDRKAQCLADLRGSSGTGSNGPESVGGGAGAGSGATSGTTGGGTFGGSAPR